jgi:hypothetical protein
MAKGMAVAAAAAAPRLRHRREVLINGAGYLL